MATAQMEVRGWNLRTRSRIRPPGAMLSPREGEEGGGSFASLFCKAKFASRAAV